MTRRPAAGVATVVGFVIVLVAIGLRIAAILALHAWQTPAEENRVIARNLVQGQGYTFSEFASVGPTTCRPPLYPFALATLDRLLGVESPAMLATTLTLNVIAGGAAVGLMMVVAGRAFGDRAVLPAGALLAVWPAQIYAVTQFQGLTIAVALILAAIWACQRQWPIAAGVVIGLAALCESVLLLPLIATGLWIFRRRPDALVLLLVAVIALTLPWAYRNSIVRQRPTLLTGRLGVDLFYGNGPQATGSRQIGRASREGDPPQSEIDLLSPAQFDSLRHLSEADRDLKFFDWAKTWIAANPSQYLRLCAARVAKTLWYDWSHRYGWNPLNSLPRTAALGLTLAAVALRRPGISALIICMTGLVVATTFTLAEARNSVLIDAPQLLAAAALLIPNPLRSDPA